MKPGRNTFAAAIVSIPASLISLTRRSCKVPKERSTRPLAGAELAHRMSMLSSCSARPNWVMPSPLAASRLLTRKMACLSEVVGDRTPEAGHVGPGLAQVVEGRLGRHEGGVEDPAGGVVDIGDQRAFRPAVLEPEVLRAVDLLVAHR